MKSKYLKIYITVTVFVTSLLFNACSTNPLLTENIKINSPEKQKLEVEVERFPAHTTYKSNISNFIYPTEDELYSEANIKNASLYSINVNVLSDWVLKNLTTRHKTQLIKNCELLVGQFDKKFPMDERTIACAAWWIEKKNSLLAQNNISPADDRNLIRMSGKQRKNWLNFEDLSIQQSLPLIDIDTPKNTKFYIQKAYQFANKCSLKNATVALLFKLENYLPNSQVYIAMEKIYTKMLPCLVPNQEPAEKIHLRMGLLRLLRGNTQLAFEALKRTQFEKDPNENSRNLFWLGTIYKKMHPNEKSNKYWRQLIKENPLSLAAIVANQQMEIDPMSVLVPDEKISMQNRTDTGWSKENLETFVFENLLAKRKIDAAIAWANYVTNTTTTTNPDLNLYWAFTQNKLRNYYSSIHMFFRYMKNQKDNLISRSLIDLQFPKPYLREILQVTSDVDPILILSLMRQESAFDENARSSANARGLMQILPNVAKTIHKWVKPTDLYDPDTNIEVGYAFLQRLFKRYDGKTENVLAAYNAGSSNLDKWLTRVPIENTMLFCDYIPFKESRTYVSIILRNYYWYSRIFSESNDLLTQSILVRSLNARFKPERVQALLSSHTVLSPPQKDLLNNIYLFGNSNGRLNAQALATQSKITRASSP